MCSHGQFAAASGLSPAAVRGLAADGVLVEALGEIEILEDELDRRRDAGGGLAHAEVGERLT